MSLAHACPPVAAVLRVNPISLGSGVPLCYDIRMSDIDRQKLISLCEIMGKVHALADHAWPRDATGVSTMSDEDEQLIIDIQQQAALALGLPEDLNLMTGDPAIDID